MIQLQGFKWIESPSSRSLRTFWVDDQYCLTIFPTVASDKYHALIEDKNGFVHVNMKFTAEEIMQLYGIEMLQLSS